MQIADLLQPREEVIEGQFQGVLQAHKVGDSADRLENDPTRLLSMTYPSNALQTAFERVDDKLRGSDSQGGITLSGPYGAGKSHGLITLYHLFNSPNISKDWLAEWNIDLPLPDTTRASILSTSETDADQIWEPIFDNLNGSEILEGIKRYPTTEHIEALVGDDTVAIFFDEIETWWESFDRDEDGELLERNEFFLQNLLEVANDPERNLFVFVTLLDKSPGFKRILNRTNPYAVDMNDTGDRERIILHRLFETPVRKLMNLVYAMSSRTIPTTTTTQLTPRNWVSSSDTRIGWWRRIRSTPNFSNSSTACMRRVGNNRVFVAR
ncbi:hypothetical protein [Salinigranum rubrum]|uniref:hypothetical protein n=1 Tax=Salinigranum rubrum TaxID=755307 RepID=UPI001FE9D074|nr:hypothetical protein [Salinigranum rubrum]